MFQIRTSASARLSSFAQSLSFLVLLLVGSPVQATNACASATSVELNTTFRTYADVGEPLLVELEIPSAGILSVDVIAINTFSSDFGNGLLSLDCLPRAASKPIVVERSPEHQILAVSGSGTYVFRVASLDRRRPLGELKLLSAFVPASNGSDGYGENEDEIEIDGFADPSHNYGENEDEIEIDGFTDPSHEYGENEDEIEIDGFADPSHNYGENEDEIEIDGFADPSHEYGENEDEIEIDGFADPLNNYGENEDEIEIDGFAAPEKLQQLCDSGEVDDHGDSFACATLLKLGRVVSGSIKNDWGDDVDTFRFEFGGASANLWPVAIEVAGDYETTVALFDRHGQILDRGDGDGHDDPYRLVRALPSGVYYVRVEGLSGFEGEYGLRISTTR